MSASSPIVLPIVNIQHDFLSVISDVDSGIVPAEDIWVSCYKSGEPSVHGKVRVSLDEVDRSVVKLDARDGVEFRRGSEPESSAYAARCSSLEIPWTLFTLPSQEWRDPERANIVKPHSITAFDVSPDGSQYATGYHDGTVHILPTSASSPTPSHLQKARPHLSTVTSLRFFPSSRVLLTAGNDFALSVLSAESLADAPSALLAGRARAPLQPVRTLRGHTRAVTATAMLGRGQTVLSGAKDGSVCVWDVATGTQTRAIHVSGFSPVLGMALGERGDAALNANGEKDAAMQVDEGTEQHLVWAALGDGTFEAFDIRSAKSVFWSKQKGAALSAINYSAKHNLVATGSTKGVVQAWDTRSLERPVVSFVRGSSGVEDLSFVDVASAASLEATGGDDAVEVGLVIAAEDGLPFIAGLGPDGPRVVAELVGPDCERVGHVRVRGDGIWGSKAGACVWVAADDGLVRKY